MSSGEGRQRLRPWLVDKINSGEFPGLSWMDPDKTEFKVPWKHGSKHDWTPDEGKIFQEWARHTGKYTQNVDKPDWVTWKTRLRCAFNKAPDIEEQKNKRCYDGPQPYRVYKFIPKPGCSDKSMMSLSNIPSNDLLHVSGEHMPSIPSLSSGGMFSFGSASLPDGEAAAASSSSNNSMGMDTSDSSQEAHHMHSAVPSMLANMSPDHSYLHPTSQIAEMGLHQLAEAATRMVEVAHDNCPMKGHEMQLTILYKNMTVSDEHILHPHGTRIYYGQPQETMDPSVQSVLNVQRKDVMLAPPRGIVGEDKSIKYIESLLQYMQRGLILECIDGDIYATRLCRTAIYYANYFTQETQKIERPEHEPPTQQKIFDYQTFEQSLQEFELNPDRTKTPDTVINLFIGQRGTAAQYTKVLICAQVRSCKAEAKLRSVLAATKKSSLSFEISNPTPQEAEMEYELVRQQINQ